MNLIRTKELVVTIARSAGVVAVVFFLAWLAGPLPQATIQTAFAAAVLPLPLVLAAGILVGAPHPHPWRLLRSIPLSRYLATACWLLAGMFGEGAAAFSFGADWTPMICRLLLAVALGATGLALVRPGISGRDSVTPSKSV